MSSFYESAGISEEEINAAIEELFLLTPDEQFGHLEEFGVLGVSAIQLNLMKRRTDLLKKTMVEIEKIDTLEGSVWSRTHATLTNDLRE